MNLLLLIGAFPPGPFGGAETQAEAWAGRLATRHRVTVITRRRPATRPLRERRDGYEVVSLPVSGVPMARTWLDREAAARVIGTLVPRPDLALCFQTFVSGWIGVHVQRRLGIPALVWVRGEDEIRLGARLRARLLSRGVWRAARGVLVQSDEMRGALLGELGAADRAALEPKLAVVPNGIELPAMQEPGARGDRVLAVGRLESFKGFDIVIDAVAAIGGRLTVAGDGSERSRLEARARERGLDARFLGRVDRATLQTLYREARCLALGSRFGEGFPNVLLEAMAHGCPVVATRITGVPALVEDGVDGLLVPSDDVPAMGDALARLTREPGLAARLGTAARATAGRYAWDAVEPRLEDVLARWGTR
ncbi:MAG: glycosyltransferase family 4 protein [Candidatus Eisenbacteria bacterium]